MKKLTLCLVLTGISACGQKNQDSSTVQSAKPGLVSRPAQKITLNGKDAVKVIDAFKTAGVPVLEAIESTTWNLKKIECSQIFRPEHGLQTACNLGLPSMNSVARGSVSRPDQSIVLNGKEARSFITILEKTVGIKPLIAIESKTWSTGVVECSQSFQAEHGLSTECTLAL